MNQTFILSAPNPSENPLSFTIPYSTLFLTLLVLVTYALYYWKFSEAEFVVHPRYDQRKKRIGKTLPPYPNGWYVALHSKELKKGETKPCDIAGQNIVLIRDTDGKVHALHAYCAHMGAHLGIGGKVINKKCVQCPFHGWLYDAQTGKCVDHNGKPLQMRSAEYNSEFWESGKCLKWKESEEDHIALRRYPTQELNGYIYIWIHSMPQYQQKPQYSNINIESLTKNLEYRGHTKHHIMCHIQDIPQNGADILHFKYVHEEMIPGFKKIGFNWKAKWKRGDDPDLKEIFQHDKEYIREFKMEIYEKFIKTFPEKKYLSVGYIDNFIKLPLLGNCFMFNATIVQYGPATVFIFLRSPLYKIAFQQFLQPQDKAYQLVYHQMYTNRYIPYWLSALALKLEGDQVTNDMYLWQSKKFASKLYYRKGMEYDDYLQKWRQWYARHYQGCQVQLQQKNTYDW